MLVPESTLHHSDARAFSNDSQMLLLKKRNDGGRGKEGDKFLGPRAHPSERYRPFHVPVVSPETSLTESLQPCTYTVY